jgi:GcrA cell cycle regulator
MSWTPEAEALLRQLWNVEKLSAVQIGRRVHKTANAVIGKADRLGLDQRESPLIARRPRPAPAVKPISGAGAVARAQRSSLPRRAGGGGSVAALVGRAAESCPKVTLPQLGAPPPQDSRPVWKSTTSHYPAEMTCQFPTDTPPRGVLPTFCGATRHPGRPYCLAHCERAYTGFRAEAVAA